MKPLLALLWGTFLLGLYFIAVTLHVVMRSTYFFVPAIWWNLRDIIAEEWFDVKDENTELWLLVRSGWKEYFA